VSDSAAGLEFARTLDEALTAAQSLRGQAESLSSSILVDKPETVREAALAFEGRVEETRPIFNRLLNVLRHAHHHTLESAYQALVGDPARQADAERMRQFIREYQKTRAIITMSERRINDALRGIERNPWIEAREPKAGDSTFLAKA